jgi:uncharacterized protein with FMN-binding domain
MTPTAPRTRSASPRPRSAGSSSSRRGQRHRVERRIPTSVLAVTAAAAGAFFMLRHPVQAAQSASATTAPATTMQAAGAAPAGAAAKAGSAANGAGMVTGKPVDTDFGPMQVAITVHNGKITGTKAVVVTTAGRTSDRINARSLPVLYQQTLQRQSAKVDSISGATVTSVGYQKALQSAIDAAHLA